MEPVGSPLNVSLSDPATLSRPKATTLSSPLPSPNHQKDHTLFSPLTQNHQNPNRQTPCLQRRAVCPSRPGWLARHCSAGPSERLPGALASSARVGWVGHGVARHSRPATQSADGPVQRRACSAPRRIVGRGQPGRPGQPGSPAGAWKSSVSTGDADTNPVSTSEMRLAPWGGRSGSPRGPSRRRRTPRRGSGS